MTILFNGWEAQNLGLAYLRAFRECRSLGLKGVAASPWATHSILQLSRGNHAGLVQSIDRLLKFDANGLGLFYLAHSHFLNGRYDECISVMDSFLRRHPNHPDGCYLLVQALTAEANQEHNDREFAWRKLEGLAAVSQRLKTWLIMGNLVQNATDFRRLMEAWHRAQKIGLAPRFNANVNNYLSVAALRGGEFEAARQFWRHSISIVAERKPSSLVSNQSIKPFSPHLAVGALEDVSRALAGANIPSFLVSGTLLGAIREGRLLGHDKDVDIGVWEDVPRDKLLKILGSCGLFYIQASRAPETIRLKHVNGTAIDVFYHFREEGSIWHGGVKAHWRNSQFSLTERELLGGRYLIPEHYESYLEENYGDWKTPKTTFDSVYDTPNAEVVNEEEIVIHDYRMLLEGLQAADNVRITRYRDSLVGRGEGRHLPSCLAQ